MVFRLPSVSTKQLQKLISKTHGVPKGHVAVYVGDYDEEKKRYVVPLSCLSRPAFQDLLHRAEEEFGFNHPMGGLTIPCDEETFIHVLSDPMRIAEGMGNHSVGIFKCTRRVNKESISCQQKYEMQVPKGHFAVYIGEEENKRFVVPVSYLKHPRFQELLREAEEKFGYDHGMGRLTVPCTEYYFIDLISQLHD